jgi:hypothetical protein
MHEISLAACTGAKYLGSFMEMLQWHTSTTVSKHGRQRSTFTASKCHLYTTKWRTLQPTAPMAQLPGRLLLPEFSR